MTMFTLPNFCRVCLKYDKNLIDLAHIENEPSETLMSKLQLCVSEVEWNVYKPLLCHPCIKRLNIAYGFKKQCVQSAGVLKNYVELVKESQKKNESQTTVKSENIPQGGAYMLLPNQKYVKILVGSQNQGNTFQNVFLNLIPTSTVTPATGESGNAAKSKDTNQNVFLNINNTFQKFVPIAPDNTKKSDKNVNVNQLLTETKTEELSVEIDPTDFTGLEEDDSSNSGNEEDTANDWDEVISPTKIASKDGKEDKCSSNQNGNQVSLLKHNVYANYVPILPKHDDFINSGQHFLSSSFESSDFTCETCQKNFSSVKLLKHHIKQFHLGKLPFKCEYCYVEFALRADYEMCRKRHKMDSDALNNSLTLQDFANTSGVASNAEKTELASPAGDASSSESGEFICNICNRPFNSSTGLLRHKVRKHNQTNKKKYFIKGMKNAKCDICNREFSTQSYMQLHRKLHLRDDIGYKYKVFGRSKYDINCKENSDEASKVDLKNEEVETIDVTPDLLAEEDREDDKNEDSDSLDEPSLEIDLKAETIKEDDNIISESSNNECENTTMEVDENGDNSEVEDDEMSDEN